MADFIVKVFDSIPWMPQLFLLFGVTTCFWSVVRMFKLLLFSEPSPRKVKVRPIFDGIVSTKERTTEKDPLEFDQ